MTGATQQLTINFLTEGVFYLHRAPVREQGAGSIAGG